MPTILLTRPPMNRTLEPKARSSVTEHRAFGAGGSRGLFRRLDTMQTASLSILCSLCLPAPALTAVHSEHQQRTAEQGGGVTVSSAQPSI